MTPTNLCLYTLMCVPQSLKTPGLGETVGASL
jgi:hypothetical protein